MEDNKMTVSLNHNYFLSVPCHHNAGSMDSNGRSQSKNLAMAYVFVHAALTPKAHQRGGERTGILKDMEEGKTLLGPREGSHP